MESKDFDEFVRRQQAEASISAAVNWDQERKDWLANLQELYTSIESLLGKYTRRVK